MESINLGAVLFALLLLLWVLYALPRTAGRRDVMGRARRTESAPVDAKSRDLSAAVHSRRTSREVSPPMTQDRLLLRPADPTSRPRFDATPGERVDPLVESTRRRGAMKAALVVLGLAVLGLTAGVVLGAVHWVLPLLAAVVLAAYVVGLRRAELERRTRARRAAALARLEEADHAEAAARASRPAPSAPRPAPELPARTPLQDTADRAQELVSAPGEWTPRPVPRPTYALRGEVEDLASRHAAHRESLRASAVPLERDGVEAIEAADEVAPAPAMDLGLDEVLARRRA
ncbi:hypothetical protein GCM10009592_00540 [Brachybacterium rhamnosum]|uniref:Uncharacterized protein n=1 Tax=Brachybacterium rhamnosum TaxID=173361 RepID=A0ABW4PVI1_9MICO